MMDLTYLCNVSSLVLPLDLKKYCICEDISHIGKPVPLLVQVG